jgi:SAM-dependent methyltransferase
VSADPPAYGCPTCHRDYPIVGDIPDFRVWPDPYIDAPDDWAKGERVERESKGGFEAMLRTYWRLTPDVPAAMAARFIRYALVGAARGASTLERVCRVRVAPIGQKDVVLDLGCGSGGLVTAAARQAGWVVGVDIAARWLIIAKAQLAEAGVDNACLVCACAEYLPFADNTFDIVVASDVLEHCQDQPRLLNEARRALRTAGLLLVETQNRWSLRGEPHVRAWGVGFLPRRWMAAYVRMVRGVPYRFIRLVSIVELELLLRRARLRTQQRLLPDFDAAETEGLAPAERRLVRLYRVLKNVPGVKELLLVFGPEIEVAARPI